MADVVIYTAPLCPYCHMAKQLLSAKGIRYEEIDVVAKPERRSEMKAKAGGRHTVPQIWIGQMHIGGCDDLMALERAGELNQLLGAENRS